MKYPIFFILTAVCLNACQTTSSAPTDNQKLFVGYYVRHTADDNQLKIEATFKTGDTVLTALTTALKGEVFCNKTALPLRTTVQGESYSATGQQTRPDTAYTFEFSNPKTASLETHRVTMSRPDSIFCTETSVAKGIGVQWTGAPLKTSETLVLQLTDAADTYNFNIIGPTSTNSFFLPKEETAKLKAGKATVMFVKNKIQRLPNSPKTSGTVTMEYYYKPTEITLK